MALSRHALPFHQRPCDEPVPVAGKDVRHQQCIEINRNKVGVTFYSSLHDFPTRNREINSPLKGGRRRERYSDVLCPHPLQLAPVSRPVFPPVCSPTWLNAFSTTEIFALTGVSSHLPNGLRLSGIPSAGVIWIPAHTMLSVFFPPSARPSPCRGKKKWTLSELMSSLQEAGEPTVCPCGWLQREGARWTLQRAQRRMRSGNPRGAWWSAQACQFSCENEHWAHMMRNLTDSHCACDCCMCGSLPNRGFSPNASVRTLHITRVVLHRSRGLFLRS